MADSIMPGDRGGEGYGLDLNPDFLSGQNSGLTGPHPEKADNVRTAYDIKALHNKLSGYEDDELKGIPVLPAGTPLEQGATYIDLRARKPKEITAMGGMEAGSNNWYVPKTEVDYQVWNRLLGVQNAERLGQANEGATTAAPAPRARSKTATPASAQQGQGAKPRGRAAKGETAASSQPERLAKPTGSLATRSTRRAAAGSATPAAEAPEAGAGQSRSEFVATPEGIPETESGVFPSFQSYGGELH